MADPINRNKEEKRVILGSESKQAKANGEGVRTTDEPGTYYPVKNATSTK